MSTEIRATVRRFPRTGGSPNGEHWCAVAYTITDGPDGHPDTYEITWCSDVAEAITAALRMRSRLDQQLMDEGHASRAARRAATDAAGLLTVGEPA